MVYLSRLPLWGGGGGTSRTTKQLCSIEEKNSESNEVPYMTKTQRKTLQIDLGEKMHLSS